MTVDKLLSCDCQDLCSAVGFTAMPSPDLSSLIFMFLFASSCSPPDLRMSTCSSFVDSQLKVLIGWRFYLRFCNLVNFSSGYHFPRCDWIFFCSQNARLQSSLVFIHALKEVNNFDVKIIHRYMFLLWMFVKNCDHKLIMGIIVQTWRHELDLLQNVCGSVSREVKAGIHPDLGPIVSCIELCLVIR